MPDNEKLIKEAACAIHAVAEGGASWASARMADKDQHRAEARAALAVFEKAHTPTNDEREATQDSERLRQLAESLAMDTGQGEVAARLNAIADRIDRMVPIADLEAAWRVGARHASRADAAEKALAERSEPHGEPSRRQLWVEEEPGYFVPATAADLAQGEPSEAQVEAAARSWVMNGGVATWDNAAFHIRDNAIRRMREALRAAGVGGAR